MREINFKTEGICAHGVKVTIDDNNIIQNVQIHLVLIQYQTLDVLYKKFCK